MITFFDYFLIIILWLFFHFFYSYFIEFLIFFVDFLVEKTRQQILENMNFTEENERPNILIVDDNADMREYLTKLLKFNYNILTACDGIEVIRKF